MPWNPNQKEKQTMEITKVKYKNGSVYYEYQTDRPTGEKDEHKVKCHDAPRPSFEDAWNDLRHAICTEAELPEDMAGYITPTGISISYYDDGRWGAVLSGTRSLEHSNAPLCINTPHKPAEPSEFNPEDTMIMDSNTVGAIETMIQETEAYIRGERAQGALKLEVA